MLVELSVENYAVIEQVRVRFHSGLNLLTGETGSGKSIVVDALGLLLGGRASAETVRAGAPRARVSGIFEVTPTPALTTLLDAGFIDTFRHFEPGPGHYTWWSQMMNCRARNIGWRVDYFVADEKLKPALKKAWISPEVLGSDHCPVGLEIR